MDGKESLKIDELLDSKDLMQILKVCSSQIWCLRNAGKLPVSVKIGKSYRWRASDISLWIEFGCPPLHKFERMKQSHNSTRTAGK